MIQSTYMECDKLCSQFNTRDLQEKMLQNTQDYLSKNYFVLKIV